LTSIGAVDIPALRAQELFPIPIINVDMMALRALLGNVRWIVAQYAPEQLLSNMSELFDSTNRALQQIADECR